MKFASLDPGYKLMSKSIINVEHLTKIYGTDGLQLEVLSDISLNIDKGEFVAIMGPSGSGKSTLMHILGALDVPTKGRYFLDGADIGKLGEDELSEIRNRKVGFIFQAYNLLPRTTAIDNVMLPMDYAGVAEKEQVKRAKIMLEKVGLADRMYHAPNQLSGGQQQRVAIARSLIMKPAIILADEPTGNIASVQAEEIMSIFEELNDEGHTIVMITHEADIAEHAKRIIHLLDGKIVKDGNGHKRRVVNGGKK